ncbi:MAG: anaerobic sulfatase maturase [Bryobacteraceae bacterium]
MNRIPPNGGGFHVLAKPIGPICNLDCKYCFYLDKEKLYPDERKWRMSDAVLEEYIRQYVQAQPGSEVAFTWQGGEPTLLGVDFFRKVVALQEKHANGKKISNALQTNGVLLNGEWCDLFAEHRFLIGISIDGPRELHDRYRVDKGGKSSFDAVVRGMELLKREQVEFNTLTVVHRANSQRPLDVYRFLKEMGSGFIQFIPLVERHAAPQMKLLGLSLDQPPVIGEKSTDSSPVTSWSVESKQYGRFLCEIFDEWARQDIGRVFVQLFDVALGNWMDLGSSLCVFAEKCGAALAIEHNGDLYSCDHYVYPRYRLGNIMDQTLGEMVHASQQVQFGNEKLTTLPVYCQQCEVRFACNGECPKHRFIQTPEGEPGLNYLCAGYKRFFNYIDPYMRAMAKLLRSGRPAADLMQIVRERAGGVSATQATGRNDPCPCGSGRKFKKCCGAG